MRRRYKPKGTLYEKYTAPEFRVSQRSPGGFRRDLPEHPSVSPDVGEHNCSAVEDKVYSGTLVVGISCLHKSNAVPVINQEQILEIAKMRRS